jgi:hypothetical protein
MAEIPLTVEILALALAHLAPGASLYVGPVEVERQARDLWIVFGWETTDRRAVDECRSAEDAADLALRLAQSR